jgi:hypothetical protein
MAKEYRYTSAEELLRKQGGLDRTVLHRLAEDAELDQVFPALLTPELLTHADPEGLTPLHSAATHGSLRQLTRVLTGQLLLWSKGRSANWPTPLQIAALTEHFDQIPPNLLTPEMMMSSSESDPRTVAEILVEQHLQHLRQVLPTFAPRVRAIFAAVLTDSPGRGPKGNAEQSRRNARRA